MVTVGVRDEYLAKAVTRNQADYLLHPAGIQLVEDIVQQQQGSGLGCRTFQEVELRQFQGEDISLVLSLRTLALHGMVPQRKFQVVTMDTMQGIAYSTVLSTVTTYYL